MGASGQPSRTLSSRIKAYQSCARRRPAYRRAPSVPFEPTFSLPPSRQIEAARIAITRYMKREGQVWIRIFPDKPMTSKPAEVRMGKGKGAPSHWVAPVRPGRIMFEVDGVELDTAKEALRLGAQKLPVRCKLVTRPDLAEK